MSEWPLVTFTLLVQSSVGVTILLPSILLVRERNR